MVWLGSRASRHVTGRVFELKGGELCLYPGHRPGPSVDKGARWEPAELSKVVDELLARAPAPLPVYGQS